MASILFIWLAGIDARASAKLLPNTLDGLPLIRNRIFELPCNSTFPSISTVTCGTFFSTSIARPPWEVISFAALYTVLSILFSMIGLSPVMVTPWRLCIDEARYVVPNETERLPGLRDMLSMVFFS